MLYLANAAELEQDTSSVSAALPTTIHYNTSFCARIIKPSQEKGNSIACYGCYYPDDPISCFSHPGEYIRKNLTIHEFNDMGEYKHDEDYNFLEFGTYDQTWSSCFEMELDQTVSAYSMRMLLNVEYVCNKMDDTWSIVFDTLNSTFNELLYYKFGDCDDHGYGRYQEIMFDDMNNNELQVYNEELLNRLQSPLDGTHLDCFYLFNKKASVNDTRLTKIETYLCSNSNDCSMKLCDDNPDYFKCKHLELVGSRLGFDYIGWSYQRQEDDQVCITYTDYTPNKYQQYACYSFCMNVGEETKVFFGNEFQIVRVSDKNDTVFTTVEVYVTRRYDSKYDPNLEDDDMYGPDDDYLYPSYQPTTILWLHTLSKFESQLEDDDMYFGLDEIHDDFKLDEVHDDYTDRELGDDEYLNDPLSYSIDDDNCLRDDDILGHHYHGYLGENCYPNYHHHETNNQSFITSSPIMFGFVLGFGIFSSVFGSLYIIKFLKRRKSLRGGDLFEISDLEMMEEDRSGQKEEGNAEII